MDKAKQHPRDNFQSLLKRIQPSEHELSRAKSHITSTKKRLQKSFDLKAIKPIGSHARKTAIRTFSDLDYMALLSRNEAKWGDRTLNSNTVIKKLSQDLNDRFHSTVVRKDMQAIVIKFGNGNNSLDVVPSFFHRWEQKRPVFHIPDGHGGWMETSPELHNTYFKKENSRSSEKLKKLGQLIRYWKHCRNSPISSFYIDMILACSQVGVGAKSYSTITRDFFSALAKINCNGIHDPMNIAGAIYPNNTASQREKLKKQVVMSLERANKALHAEATHNYVEANRLWNSIFNNYYL